MEAEHARPGGVDRWPARALDALVTVLLVAVFVPMALWRLADAHEGIELISARLVTEGKLPYHDFMYPDLPLLPYVYGLWMRVTGVSWYAGRLLSALLAVGVGLVLYQHVARATGRRAWGALAAVLLATSGLAFVWYPLVKTPTLATFLLLSAYAVLETGRTRWKYLACGVALALAIDTRLYLAALIPVFAVAAFRAGRRPRDLGHFAAGTGLGLLPNLPLIVRAPDVWLFDVLGHHWMAGTPELSEKLQALLNLLGIAGSFGAASLQFMLLFVVWLCSVVSAALLRERLPRSAPIVAVLTLLSLLPTASYAGYFHTILPFLIADVVVLLARLRAAVTAPGADFLRGRLADVPAILIALYLVVAPVDAYTFTVGGEVPGTYPRALAKHWRIPAINRVARAIDEEMPPAGRAVIAWWPGHVVESRAVVLPRLENPVALWYSPRLTPDLVSRYHFISHPELAAHIQAHTAPLVVVGVWMKEVRAVYGEVLRRSGYVRVRTLEDMEIYRWKP